MNKYGLIIAPPGGSITSDKLQYDSNQLHMQIALGRIPAHMDSITIQGGTAYVDNTFNATTTKETLFQIEHGYGFTPYCLAYFYISQIGFDMSLLGGMETLVGDYANDTYVVGTGAAGDYVQIDQDDKYFRIIHVFQTFGFNTGYTSLVPQIKFQVKYYITSLRRGQ